MDAALQMLSRASQRFSNHPAAIDETDELQPEPGERLSQRASLRRDLRSTLPEPASARSSRRSSTRTSDRRPSRFYQPPKFHMSILSESELSQMSAASDTKQAERTANATELFFDLVNRC